MRNLLLLLGLLGVAIVTAQWLWQTSADDSESIVAISGQLADGIVNSASDNQAQNLVTTLALNETANFTEEQNNQVSVAQSGQGISQSLNDESLNQVLPSDVPVDTVVGSEELRSLLKIDINFMIETWRMSWQSGDSDTYLSLYSPDFTPVDGQSRQEWQQQRKRRVTPTHEINIELSNFEVELDDANQQAVVSFDQNFSSNSTTENSRKQLTLIKENQWLIVSELTVN